MIECRSFIFVWLLFGLTWTFDNLWAQKSAYNWIMGEGAGLNFSASAPLGSFVAKNKIALNPSTCCSSVSSAKGDLLFYTDGFGIYAADGKLLKEINNSPVTNDHISTLIIQDSYKGNEFTLFWVRFNEFQLKSVNISISNKVGTSDKVFSISKITDLLPGESVQTKLAISTYHDKSKHGFWLVVRGWNPSATDNKFFALPYGDIPKKTITTSFVGEKTGGTHNIGSARGYMTISIQGDKIALTHTRGISPDKGYFTELFDFDKTTGKVSNPVLLSSWIHPSQKIEFPYGVAFSPMGKYLYVGNRYLNYKSGVYQFDLTAPDIPTSRVSVAKLSSPIGGFDLGSFSLTPEGKIYFAHGTNYLGKVTYPDRKGIDCLASASQVHLSETVYDFMPQFDYSKLDFSIDILQPYCGEDSIKLTYIGDASLVSKVVWNVNGRDMGDNKVGIAARFKDPVTVDVSVTSKSGVIYNRNLNYRLKYPTPFSLGNDIKLPCGSSTTLGVRSGILKPGSKYLWNEGSTTSTLKISKPGVYTLKVTDPQGCSFKDTVRISSIDNKLSLPSTITYCDGVNRFEKNAQSLIPAGSFPIGYLWTSKSIRSTSAKIDHKFSIDDTVYLEVNYGHCKIFDTVDLKIQPKIQISLGEDISACDASSAIHRDYDFSNQPPPLKPVSFLWSDGSTQEKRALSFRKSQLIWVEGKSKTCSLRDSLKVTFSKSVYVNIGGDTTLCQGNQLLLNASRYLTSFQKRKVKYLWQNGSTLDHYWVNKPGKYYVDLYLDTCRVRKEIKIDYHPKLDIMIPPKIFLCESQKEYEINLADSLSIAQIKNADVKWSDGTKDLRKVFRSAGKYFLEITIFGCLYRYDFEIFTVSNPNFFSTKNNVICYDDPFTVDLYNRLPKELHSITRFSWSDGSHLGKRTFPKNVSSTYRVTANIDQCHFTDAISISYQKPIDTSFVRDTVACYHEETVNFTGPLEYKYLWSTGIQKHNIVIGKTGSYWVQVSQGKCYKTKKFKVAFYLGPKITYRTGVNHLNVSVEDGEYPPFYHSIDGKNYKAKSTFIDLSPGTYYIWTRDQKGCIYQSMALEVLDLIIPKFFTPNGDGIHDVWRVEGLHKYPNSRGFIYNRYGRTLYQFSSNFDFWDGREQGQLLPPDTYWYTIEVKGQKISGYFTLLRN